VSRIQNPRKMDDLATCVSCDTCDNQLHTIVRRDRKDDCTIARDGNRCRRVNNVTTDTSGKERRSKLITQNKFI